MQTDTVIRPPAIRPVEDADIPALIALWHAAGVARPWNDPATDIAFARRGPHSTILVATQDGTIAASAMVGEDGHRGWVYYVAVDPARQRSGLGAAIMAAAEDWLRARGSASSSCWSVRTMPPRTDSTSSWATTTPGRCASRR